MNNEQMNNERSESATIELMAEPKVALITGAGKERVGRHVAEALARRGDRIVLHYRSSRADAEAAVAGFHSRGVAAVALQADLTREDDVIALVRHTQEQFGRLDVLVHAAADWKTRRLEDTTAADIRRIFDTNAVATFAIAQHAGLAMAGQPTGGAIVLLGDWATVRPYRDYAAYLASKGTIPTITRTLAVELAARNPNVRVNAILPGPVMMPADLPEAERRAAIAATLVKREGRPENVAHAALFLIDNDFVTGVCLPVDGGRTIYAPDAV
jgi:pteridine reductase